MIETKDKSNRLTIELSNESDYSKFEEFAVVIQKEFEVEIIKQLDGIDQHFWDFDFGNCTLVLHLEHFIGIDIQISDGSNEDLLREVAKKIKEETTQ